MSGYAFVDDDAEPVKFVRVYFSVLYSEKNTFKALGGEWDRNVEVWYKNINIDDVKDVGFACCCRGKCGDCRQAKFEKTPRRKAYILANKPEFPIVCIYDPNNYLTDNMKQDIGGYTDGQLDQYKRMCKIKGVIFQ